MMEPRARVPALVLGGYYTTLGTLRCLGDLGIPRYCLTRPESYVRASRHHLGPPGGRTELQRPAELAGYLEALPLERGVLMPCSDEWAMACAALPHEFAARFRYCGPGLEDLRRVLDKSLLEARLDQLGIARPRTRPVHGVEDLSWLEEDPGSVWFLKPADSQAFRRSFGRKAIRVASRQEALPVLERCRQEGLELLLQEYVPGSADRHYFVDGFIDRHGSLLAVLARRRIRMHPRDFGDSSYLRGVELAEASEAVQSCRTLLGDGSFRGIFSAEFKRDPRDERFRLIEVNARPWAYVGFAQSCGFNAPAMAYRDALELPQPEPLLRAKGRRFQILPHDLMAAREAIAGGDLDWGRWLRQSWGAESVLFRVGDPLPAVVEAARILGERLRALLRRA